MPNLRTAGETFRKLTDVSLYLEALATHGSTTTSAAITGSGSETTTTVLGITNFTASDPCLIVGSGGVELVTIGTPNTTMPITPPPLVPQDSGAAFLEARRIQMGKISENGVGITTAKPLTEILSAIDDGPIAFIDGNLSISFSFGLYAWNALSFQMAAGYLDAETGAGASAADPFQGIIGKLNQTLMGSAIVRLTGTRHDSKNVFAELMDCRFEPSGEITHNRQAPAVIQVTGRARMLKVGYHT